MLEIAFAELAKKYTDNTETITSVWNEIAQNHSHPKRYYHSLVHLEHLFTELTEVKDQIIAWEGIVFAICFHDMIYNVTKHKNEEMSSEYAGKKLNDLHVPVEIIKATRRMITATKKHAYHDDPDVNYFTDADLSILGAPAGVYTTYCGNIRKEYAQYPDLVYKPGRKKVVEHFLAMERIFKTDYFFTKYETQARANLKGELLIF